MCLCCNLSTHSVNKPVCCCYCQSWVLLKNLGWWWQFVSVIQQRQEQATCNIWKFSHDNKQINVFFCCSLLSRGIMLEVWYLENWPTLNISYISKLTLHYLRYVESSFLVVFSKSIWTLDWFFEQYFNNFLLADEGTILGDPQILRGILSVCTETSQ